MIKKKVLRVATVPIYMNIVLKGQLKFLNKYFNVIAATSYDKKHYNEIREREAIEMRKVRLCRTISPLKDIKALFQLIILIKKENPNLIHTHTPKAGLLAMLASYICRVPIRIHTVTGMPLMGVEGYKQKIFLFIEKLTYVLATNVYPNSQGLKSFIIQKNLAPETKLKVLLNGSTNGVDFDFFNPKLLISKLELRKINNLKKGDFLFLFVGRIAKEKGIEELVNAFVKLEKDLPDGNIKLILIGKFETQYGLISKEIVSLVENHINILTPGRFDDVRPFYKMSDIFVLPSFREGFPNAVLEAGAMGLPSIVTDINGCNEIITDGINGRIIPVKDEHKLYEAMKEMFLNKEENTKMSFMASKIIKERYSRKKMIQELKKEYDLLLKNNNNVR